MSTISVTTQTDAAADRRATRRAWLGFAAVLAVLLMDLLDSTIAQTAAPAIRRDLGGSFASLEWISAGYTLAVRRRRPAEGVRRAVASATSASSRRTRC